MHGKVIVDSSTGVTVFVVVLPRKGFVLGLMGRGTL